MLVCIEEAPRCTHAFVTHWSFSSYDSYPALHVYLSSALSYLSSGGRFLRSTQALYGVVYILCEIAAMAAYKAAGVSIIHSASAPSPRRHEKS